MRTAVALVLSIGLSTARPPALRAETHRFVAKGSATAYSAALEPALRLKSGDRVVTTTPNEAGRLIGPFVIDGAEAGDLLVVTLDALRPEGDVGYSTSTVVAGAIAPGGLTGRPDSKRFAWTIDAAARVVRFDLAAAFPRVDWKERFAPASFEVPLRPALEAIGVASAGRDESAAAASAQAGRFGGRMGAGALGAGSRVMLPVLQSGAWLYLGPGQVATGDGLVTGSGVQAPLSVEFSVEVVKKREWPHSSVVRPSTVVGEFEQGWPRVESAEALMTVGSGGSVSEALQRATLELHHWLDDDFGLSEIAVSIVLGQAIEYEVASVEGSQSTVVARIRKSVLPRPVAAP